MFAEQLSTAIASSTPNQLHHLSKQVWQAWAAGHLTDAQAQNAAEEIQARKGGMPGYLGSSNNAPTAFPVARVTFPKRRIQQSPDRRRSIERKRRLAASGGLPPALAARFTISEQAVLRIVADEVRANGCCSLCIDAIAARSGTSRATVQRALREAQVLGLIVVQERRRAGQKSLTNIIRVIMQEWRTWLRLTDKGSRVPRGTSSSPSAWSHLHQGHRGRKSWWANRAPPSASPAPPD